jgi:hypothetical protein
MRLINVQIELGPGKELLINGRPWQTANIAQEVDEKVFLKQTDLEQKWAVLCEMQKLLAMLSYQYQVHRAMTGDLPSTDFERMQRNVGYSLGWGPQLPPPPPKQG